MFNGTFGSPCPKLKMRGPIVRQLCEERNTKILKNNFTIFPFIPQHFLEGFGTANTLPSLRFLIGANTG